MLNADGYLVLNGAGSERFPAMLCVVYTSARFMHCGSRSGGAGLRAAIDKQTETYVLHDQID